MSSPLELGLFPDLPPEVVTAFVAMQFELSVERAARQHEQAVVAEKDAFIAKLKELIEKLEGQVHDYRRTKFGPKSEKLDPAQMELALEDLETAIAETQARIAAVEKKIEASVSYPEKVQRLQSDPTPRRGMAAHRMAGGRRRTAQILAVNACRRHLARASRQRGKAALAHRARLSGPQAGDRPWPL